MRTARPALVLARVVMAFLPITAGSLFGQSACQQTLPAGWDGLDGPATVGNPFNVNLSQKWQYVYDSSNFVIQAPISITQLYVRAALPGFTGPGGTLNSLVVTMASCPFNFAAASATMSANLASDATVMRTGAWTSGAIAAGGNTGSWISLNLTTPFNYNPALGLDLVVQIERCGGGTIGTNTDHVTGATNASRVGSGNSCAPISGGSPTGTVSIFRIDYVAGTPRWQVNQPAAHFDIDGQTNDACAGPISATRCAGASMTANLTSTAAASPWDLAIAPGSGVAGGAGGLVLPGGQVVNVNLASPGLTFLLGASFQTPFIPLSLPFTFPVAPFDLTAQMVLLTPSVAGGIALSAANEVHIVSGGVVPGPTADDSFVTVVPAQPPLHCPATLPFFGVNYTQVHVISNGRIMFNVVDTDYSPTVAEAIAGSPFVGVWCDLAPQQGGLISITMPTANLFRVTYAGVPFYNSPTNNPTWYIELDSSTGAVTLNGFGAFTQFVPAAGTVTDQWIGMSVGGGVATDAGQTTYTLGLSPGPSNATDMIYRLGLGGTLTPGVMSLIFTPNSFGNYDWTGL